MAQPADIFISYPIETLTTFELNIEGDSSYGKEKPSKIIQFFGGKTSYYIIGLIILSSLAIYLLNTVSFIFKPLVVIITTVRRR